MTRPHIYIPRDSAARSVGADDVCDAFIQACISRGVDVRVTRNGSRGMLWLEPYVEIDLPEGRVGYGPVSVSDVDALLDSGMLTGGEHPLRQGFTEDLPWLAEQTRVTFARVGVIDPLSFDEFKAHGGLGGLTRALHMSQDEVISEVLASGLRGRGGAGFPAGIKWRTVFEADSDVKYVCCNADEGDSGTFADRMLMEGDPFTLLEGMAIAGIATGASKGVIYLRSEYPDAIEVMRTAIDIARENHWLGADVLGSGNSFDVRVVEGAGSYVCGEETAMLESLEGKRGMVRPKPPIPALHGLFGKPTLVNNVLTLAAVPQILAGGAAAYQGLGVDRSRGTQVFQLAGNVARGGIVETGFGITLEELVTGYGAGTRSGWPLRAVQVGGPLGAYFPAHRLNVSMDYEALSEHGGLLGHGGVVIFDESVDMAQQARFAMEFCAAESCGKCTPCRVGSVRGIEVIDRIVANENREENIDLLLDLCDTMTDGSLCAMGGLTPLPVRSALAEFPEDFRREVIGPEATQK